jgi:hypothetical protein
MKIKNSLLHKSRWAEHVKSRSEKVLNLVDMPSYFLCQNSIQVHDKGCDMEVVFKRLLERNDLCVLFDWSQ